MRNFAFFCIFCVLIFCSKAQSFNIASQRGIDASGGLVSINSKSYYFEISFSGCCTALTGLVAKNGDGSVLWKKVLGTNEVNGPLMMITTADKHLAVVYMSAGCDFGGDTYYLAKIDTNGLVKFQLSDDTVVSVVAMPDSTLFGCSNSYLFHVTKNGYYLPFYNDPGISSIKAIGLLKSGNIVINVLLNGIQSNVEFYPYGTIKSQNTTTSSISKFLLTSSGELIARTEQGILEKYDSTLTLILNSGIKVSDVTIRNDSLYAVGNSTSPNDLFYLLMDSDFKVLHQSVLPYEGIYPNGISVDNRNKVNVTTQGISWPIPHMPYISQYQFPIDGGFAATSDVGVINYSINSARFWRVSGNSYMGSVDLRVAVKNFGKDTVRSFYLNHYVYEFGCYMLLHKLYNVDVKIPPQGTASVQTGSFSIKSFPWHGADPVPEFLQFDVCVFTTIPNFANDIKISNDGLCSTISFLNLGMNEFTASDSRIRLYPNPIQGSAKISSTADLKFVQVSDCLGRIIFENQISGKEVELNTFNLLPGVYFMKIQTDMGWTIKKVVKN